MALCEREMLWHSACNTICGSTRDVVGQRTCGSRFTIAKCGCWDLGLVVQYRDAVAHCGDIGTVWGVVVHYGDMVAQYGNMVAHCGDMTGCEASLWRFQQLSLGK